MAVPVDLYVKDDSLSPAPIQGAVVGVFDSSTSAPLAQGTTDSNGKASFLLPGTVGGQSYEVRFFKIGVLFANPQSISVLEPVNPPQTNVFDFSGTLVGTLPAATDPRLCRCTGRFMTFSNQPVQNMLVRIHAKADSGFQAPLLVDGNLVAPDKMELHTDDNGYISVDLFRTGEYYVTFAGDEDNTWDIEVPNRSSVNFIDLIHPTPATLSWDSNDAPGNAVSVGVNESVEVHYSILFTNYETVSTDLLSWVTFNATDPSIATLYIGDGILTIEGRAVGVTTITGANQPDLVPYKLPDYATVIPPLTVTVTA
jgi:hypothetical protein